MPTRRKRGRWRKSSEVRRQASLDFEKKELAAPTKFGSGPINLVATLIIGGIIGGFLLIPSNSDKPKKRAQNGNSNQEELLTESPDLLLPQEVVDEFLNAETVEDRLKHLSHREIVEERARTFFTIGPGKDEKMGSIQLLPQPIRAQTNESVRYLVTFENEEERIISVLLLEDSPKIDFDFYSRYCAPPLTDFVEGETDLTDESRVVLTETHFYAGEFSDDQKWKSLKAYSQDLEHPITLYLDRESPFLGAIESIIPTRGLRANLALSTTPKSRKYRQFEIKKINALNWKTLDGEDE